MTDKLPPIPPYPTEVEASTLKRTTVETAKFVSEVVGSFVPGVNYGKEKLLERYVSGPLEQRRVKFHERIAEGLEHLEERLEGFDPKRLGENEDFISAVYEATQAAMRSSREEKRRYLANAVINIAKDDNFSEITSEFFFKMIDRFSILHIEILRIYHEPSRLSDILPDRNAYVHGAAKDLIGKYFTSKGLPQDLLEKVLRDIDNEKLVSHYEVRGHLFGLGSLLSPFGKEFLKFIQDPFEA